MYINNRSNSFVENGILNIQPTLTADTIGEANMLGSTPYNMDLWGADPASLCTSNQFYGCFRSSNGANVINPIQSARVRSVNSFTFKYGRVDIRAKLPKGDWIWPAIWLLPEQGAYGTWPASGEIDIMESRGNDPSYAPGGVDTFASTLHWGPFFGQDAYAKTHASYTLKQGTLADDFHVYTLLWNETVMSTLIDGVTVLSVDMSNGTFWSRGGWDQNPNLHNPWVNGGPNAPFDQKFYVIFNVAVGGTNSYFPDGVGGKPWTDTSQTASKDFWGAKAQWYPSWTNSSAMQIDYIKVSQL